MTTRFYLIDYVHESDWKIVPGTATAIRVHTPTGLHVHIDAQGGYIESKEDPYHSPHFNPQESIKLGTRRFTCMIHVHDTAYLGTPQGHYHTGEDYSTLELFGTTRDADGTPRRTMLLTTNTWGRMKRLVTKIRAGAVTPIGCEQTVLARVTAELEDVKRKHGERVSAILSFAAQLLADEEFTAQVTEVLAETEQTKREFTDLSEAQSALLKVAIMTKKKADEFDRIKATWWYQLHTEPMKTFRAMLVILTRPRSLTIGK